MKLKVLLFLIASFIILLAIIVFVRQASYKAPEKPQSVTKATPSELIVKLSPRNRSNWNATAKITNLTVNQFKVSVEANTSTSSAKPFYIHLGTCDKLGPVSHVLGDIHYGKSETIKDGSIAILTDTSHSLVIQKSTTDLLHEIACGEIVAK